jgi:drug/metabolite transporter (DMT)-like permease
MVLIFLLNKKERHIPKKEIPSLTILGLTGVTFLYIFQFIGIDRTTPSTSAVLINLNVIFIAIFSVFFLKEKLTLKRGAGIFISFFGVFIVFLAQMINGKIVFNNIFFIGCILIILSAFCWAIYSIVGKKLLIKYDALTVTTYAFILGTIFYLPIVLQNIIVVVQDISFNGWMAVLYLALLCSVFGYMGWYYSLKKTNASKAAVFLNLIPLFAIIMSFFFGENITIFFILGAILIVYGVYLTQRS